MGAQGTGGGSPRLIRVGDEAEVPAALDAAAVPRGVPVLVLVGGAKGMDDQALETLAAVLRDVVVP